MLLVEDEPTVRGVAAHLLREQGYTVLEAANGIEAMRTAQESAAGEIDLLLTDVVMPLMGGQELAEHLKEIHPDTKVLYTSGYTDEAIVHNGASESSNGFMQKPFTPAVLAQKVREALEK